MMSPGTHLVKNHESQSKKQPHSLKTDSKTLRYSLLKEKYTPSIVKHNKDLNRCCLTTATRTATEITQTGYSTKNIFRSINLSFHPTGRIPQIILLLWGFLCVRIQR